MTHQPEKTTSDINLICGSEPPRLIVALDGTEWSAGDCWCTLPLDHPAPQCVCAPCRDRHGAPGWTATEGPK